MIRIDDYKKADGRIDFNAFHQAEVTLGERCYNCENLIMFSKGIKSLCHQCKDIDKIEEFDHDGLLRCPKCKETWSPQEREDYEVYGEGAHQVSCPECNYDFEVSTRVEYSFTSPELLESEND